MTRGRATTRVRRSNGSRRCRWIAMTLTVAACGGCERPAHDGTADAHDPSDGSPPPVISRWESGGSRDAMLLLDPEKDAALREALDAAGRQARDTAVGARELWQQARPDEREHWLIKWAAPVLDELGQPTGRVEHVWVRPLAWSPFRVEGVLATAPRTAIGHQPGDLVAFPIEELSDWVLKIEGRMDGPRRGGFTVEVLEKHFGAPGVSRREDN